MNPHAPLIARLREHHVRSLRNPSGRAVVSQYDLGRAANALESLSARVAELEAAALDATSGWQNGPTDTGRPEVVTLDPTPLSQIEARLAALEAAQADPAPAGVATERVCPSTTGMPCSARCYQHGTCMPEKMVPRACGRLGRQ